MLKSIYLLVSFLFLGFGVYSQSNYGLSVLHKYVKDAQLNYEEGVFQVPVVVHVSI